MSLNTIIISRGPAGADGGGGGGDLSAADIDTLAELNAIVTDATLIDTGDARLSDARTPTAHTHTLSDISDAGTAAASATGDFATSAQGTTADSALQPGGALGTPSSGTLTNCAFPTLNQSTTGNAATATTLETGRAINGVTFDGSQAITVAAAAGTLTGSTLAAGVTSSSLTSTGTITSGTWQGTAIADAYISSAATWNAKGAAGQVETYLVDDGIHSLTSSAGVCTPDANNGHSQNFTLTENVTDFNVPTNLADGESMSIGGTQDAVTPRTVTLDAAWKIYAGAAADIGSLAAGEGFELAIKRVGSQYRIWISTETA